MKRRNLLKSLGLLSVAPILSEKSLALTSSAKRHRILRFAHITDVHLKNEFGAPAKFKRCLHHIQNQKTPVDFILNGGDIVYDMNKSNLSAINAQWSLYHDMVKGETKLEQFCVLGNHDIWWEENNKGTAVYGKQYAMDQLGLAKPYYSFVRNGWKFICLDSVHLDIDGTWYIGKLGDEQFEWLRAELQNSNGHPICILSHIPILTVTNLIEKDIVNSWVMYGGDMHTDVYKLVSLFYQHKNVKLCLSGHIHILDQVKYNDVHYICDGAVSGAWWEGQREETAPGYGLLDFYDDGSFEFEYVNY